MLKCTLLDGRPLYLNMDRVLQITQPKDSENLVVHFKNDEDELTKISIGTFQALGNEDVYS